MEAGEEKANRSFGGNPAFEDVILYLLISALLMSRLDLQRFFPGRYTD